MSLGERDRFAGLVGKRYVWFEVEVESGVGMGLDKLVHELLAVRCEVPKPEGVTW